MPSFFQPFLVVINMTGPIYSPDGQFVWNGSEWVPISSSQSTASSDSGTPSYRDSVHQQTGDVVGGAKIDQLIIQSSDVMGQVTKNERLCSNCSNPLDEKNTSLVCQAEGCSVRFCKVCEPWWRSDLGKKNNRDYTPYCRTHWNQICQSESEKKEIQPLVMSGNNEDIEVNGTDITSVRLRQVIIPPLIILLLGAIISYLIWNWFASVYYGQPVFIFWIFVSVFVAFLGYKQLTRNQIVEFTILLLVLVAPWWLMDQTMPHEIRYYDGPFDLRGEDPRTTEPYLWIAYEDEEAGSCKFVLTLDPSHEACESNRDSDLRLADDFEDWHFEPMPIILAYLLTKFLLLCAFIIFIVIPLTGKSISLFNSLPSWLRSTKMLGISAWAPLSAPLIQLLAFVSIIPPRVSDTVRVSWGDTGGLLVPIFVLSFGISIFVTIKAVGFVNKLKNSNESIGYVQNNGQ